MPQKPTITAKRFVAQSKLFQVEQVDLEFSNGEQRTFERVGGQFNGAVMIVPLLDSDTLLLVREYCVGTDRYELGFPKGLLEQDEAILEAANRELMEEVGYGANQLEHVQTISTAPGFMRGHIHVVIAQDLYAKRLPGDEPEEIEVLSWPRARAADLLSREDFTEARSIAALYLLEKYQKGEDK